MAEIGGFNPSISLDVAAPAVQQQNPLAMAGDLAQLRNAVNQNVLFQQTQAARQRLGQIMSAARTPEEGLAAAQADPQVAAYVPDLLATNSSVQSALIGRQQQEEAMAQSGLQDTMKGAAGALGNPGMWDDLVEARLAQLPPSIRPQVRQGMDLVKKGLTDGLNPENPMGDLRKRMTSALVASGATDPNSAAALLGTVLPTAQTLNTGPGGAPQTGTFGNALGDTSAPGFTPGTNGGGGPQAPGNDLVSQDFAALGLGQSGAPTPLQGQTTGQLALQANQAANEAATQKSIAQQAAGLPSLLNRLDVIEKALGEVKLGGGAEAAQTMAEAAQALKRAGVDISDKTINKIAGGDLGALQVLHADIGQMLAQATAQTFAGSGSEPTAHYINTQTDALSHESDPNAVIKYINNIKANLRVEADKVAKYPEWQKGLAGKNAAANGFTPGNFEEWYWNTQYDPQKLPMSGPVSSTVDLGPIDPMAVQGAARPNKSAPAVGSVEDGWVYQGGDPSKQSSWKKQEAK